MCLEWGATTALADLIEQEDGDALLSTGDVAKLLGVSRQHVVDLCQRGDLPYVMVGTHRRIRRDDAERARRSRTKMTRDQRRSLWLAYAVAGRIVEDPEFAVAQANAWLSGSLRSNRWTREWQELLGGDIDGVLAALTSPSLRSRELRQNSPFGALLGDDERMRVLDAFVRLRTPNASS